MIARGPVEERSAGRRGARAIAPAGQVIPRTLWYMGVKTRVIPDFLDRVLEEEAPRGAVVVDLMTGTGAVAAFAAGRYRVFAADAAAYSHVIASAFIEHDPATKDDFLWSIDPQADLGEVRRRNVAALEALYGPALEREAEILERFERGDAGVAWSSEYRRFLEEPGAVHGEAGSAVKGKGLYAGVAGLIDEGSMAKRREDPRELPACLVTAYYANVYFGLRQAIEIDSLRAAIDAIDPGARHASRKKAHYLSALLHAASVSTSGTSHFAQPRHLTKPSELRAMARRRLASIPGAFEEFSRAIIEAVRATNHSGGNQCFHGDYRGLIESGRGEDRFRFPADVDLIYLDPPYTADNYSRFYHVLDVLTRYDYPPLERDRGGRILRGRYPAIEWRFQSGFSSRTHVEEEFRTIARAAAGSGAKLVVSYSSPSGLLLKEYARRGGKTGPLRRFEGLFRECYRDVSTRKRRMMHSGQGDSNISIEEILVVCRGPRRPAACATRLSREPSGSG